MKTNYILFLAITLIFSFTLNGYSQIGIGTNTPNGMLDITSANSGLVYPIVSLTRTDTQTITNPRNGLEVLGGTTVYNTNTTSNGIHSVYEGLYVWDATSDKWIPQFNKKDYATRSQNVDVRAISGSSATIDFDDDTFTPKYSGVYKISLLAHYGGGQVRNPNSSYHVNFAAQECNFTFSINSNSYSFSLQSYSGTNRDDAFVGSGTIRYSDSYTQASYVIEETLIAGTTYTFSLAFLQAAAPDFNNNGTTGAGQGYIYEQEAVKCIVEFDYINE